MWQASSIFSFGSKKFYLVGTHSDTVLKFMQNPFNQGDCILKIPELAGHLTSIEKELHFSLEFQDT